MTKADIIKMLEDVDDSTEIAVDTGTILVRDWKMVEGFDGENDTPIMLIECK